MNGKDVNTNQQQLKLIQTQDGTDTVYSALFDEHYHSLAGSLGETLYVYIQQGFEYFLKLNPSTQQLNIFEVGFGAGLNALVTLVKSDQLPIRINYWAIEKYPLPLDLVKDFSLGRFEKYRVFFQRIHQVPWNEPQKIIGNFTLFKIHADWTDFDLKHLLQDKPIHVVYYDAFSFDTQPQMWTVERMQQLFQVMAPGAVLTTYASKGQIKRNLQEAGFYIERLKGALKKRHMLRALKPIKGQNVLRYIDISNIKFDNIPINPQTLDLAIKIYNRTINPDELPPIRLERLKNGQFLIRDGRHRVTAFKLNGLTQIKAYIYTPKPQKS